MEVVDKGILADLVAEAGRRGCDYTLMSMVESKSRSLDVREGELDVVQQSLECRLGMTFYKDGRYGKFYTNRLDRSDLFDFLYKGIEATSLLASDADRMPVAAELLFSGNESELVNVYDASGIDMELENVRSRLLAVEAQLLLPKEKKVSSSVSYSEELFTSYRMDSYGKSTVRARSYYSLGGALTLQRRSEHSRIESYWNEMSFAGDSIDAAVVVNRICMDAHDKLEQKELPSGEYTVMVPSHLVSNLLSPIIKAMMASMLYQRSSFLQQSIGKKIVSDVITIADNPHQSGRHGASYYDEFGVATYSRPLITNGVLDAYFVDAYYGRKLGLSVTPASPSLLEFTVGQRMDEQMLNSIQSGVLITGFNGGNCNPVSGDFSFGIEGQIIEGGEKCGFFSGLNLTGNILELWQRVAELSAEVYESSSWKCPAILFADVKINNE